jgi:hypothetical protein
METHCFVAVRCIASIRVDVGRAGPSPDYSRAWHPTAVPGQLDQTCCHEFFAEFPEGALKCKVDHRSTGFEIKLPAALARCKLFYLSRCAS